MNTKRVCVEVVLWYITAMSDCPDCFDKQKRGAYRRVVSSLHTEATCLIPSGVIHNIFQATVVAKLSYASPAW